MRSLRITAASNEREEIDQNALSLVIKQGMAFSIDVIKCEVGGHLVADLIDGLCGTAEEQ